MAGQGGAKPGGIVRVGVFGYGRIGTHHARLLEEIPGVELSGVFDPDAARRNEAERAGHRVFETPEALIEASDAVTVAAPTSVHEELAASALEAGRHVLVEKPITPTHEAAERLVAAARERNLLLAVGHVERYNGAVLAAREAVRSPRFVEVHRLSPFPERSLDVDVVLDVMIHDIDIVFSLVRRPVERIDAIGAAVLTDKPDIANARIVFSGGAVANLTASRVSVRRMRKIRIFEPDRYLSIDYERQDLVVYTRKGPPSAEPKMSDIARSRPRIRRTEPLREELAAFAAAVASRRASGDGDAAAGGAPLGGVVGGEEGASALEAALEIGRQIRAWEKRQK